MKSTRPVVLVVMDGVGIAPAGPGNAVKAAYTPALDALMKSCPNFALKAHGTAVGLPSDSDMGNSEVGHNALGCGQIYAQGAKLVTQSIDSGRLWESETWRELTGNCRKKDSVFHFIGLLSDGNVHSNLSHLEAMLSRAKEEGVRKARIHALLDGRDVDATSALVYLDRLGKLLARLEGPDFDVRVASGGGRMKITMDRYEADWDMVRLGWETHVHGRGRQFSSAREAVETLRRETGAIDQNLPPFVIGENGRPVGPISDGDSVIFFNFRGDRAIELSRAFDEADFTAFDRGPRPDVLFAGMLQYDGDLKIPKRYLVVPPDIKNTLTGLLVEHGIAEYAVSETQKFGHVTYFWNGNRGEKLSESLETWEEVPSDRVPFEQRPWMKAAQVTDRMIAALRSGKYGFLRLNFPNGDMVGHTGDFRAARVAVETVDLCVARIRAAAEAAGAVFLVTADHGNADEMLDRPKAGAAPKAKTSHTLNPVPFIFCDPEGRKLKKGNYGLANVAPTAAELLGLTPPPMWEESMLEK